MAQSMTALKEKMDKKLMVGGTVGTKLLASLLQLDAANDFLAVKVPEQWLEPDELKIYRVMKELTFKHKKIPEQVTLMQHVDGADWGGRAPELPSYYLEQLEKRYYHNQIADTYKKVQTLLDREEEKYDPEAARDIILDSMRGMKTNHSGLLDFRDSYQLLLDQNIKVQQLLVEAIYSGWEPFDAQGGGLAPGDVLSICGRPGAGKSQLMLWMAFQAWKFQGKKPLFINMEIATIQVLQRIAAIYTQTPLQQLMQAKMATRKADKFWNSINHLGNHDELPFYILNGNLSANIDDIIQACYELEPDFVLIDGAYLLKGGKGKITERVLENAEAIKRDIAGGLELPVACSYQLNREAEKAMKKGEKASLGNIGYSDAIGQLSSTVLSMDQPEDLDSITTRLVSILKGRNGETGEFMINWDWYKMDFSACSPDQQPGARVEALENAEF